MQSARKKEKKPERKKEGKKEIALEMLQRGMDLDLIRQLTGLGKEALEELTHNA